MFPLKFCQSRWVENVIVAERAITVFPYIKQYIEKMKSLPETITCESIKKACEDKLLTAKLAFFANVACILEPFLRKFQTPKPMVPFLYNAFSELLYQLMQSFVKNDVLHNVSSVEKMIQLKLDDKNNVKSLKDVDIGVAAQTFLNKSGASDAQKKCFKDCCMQFLKETTQKIITRNSLAFRTMRAAFCLNPKLLLNNPVLCEKRMQLLLEILVEKKIESIISADRSKQQFTIFVRHVSKEWKDIFVKFSENETRLDDFYLNLFQNEDDFKDLWEIVKAVLILSHGNAGVESGFSINKDMLVENLSENSLIGLRTVYDSVKAYGGVLSIPIDNEMLRYCRASHSKYQQSLDNKKKNETKELLKQETEKRKISAKIADLEKKKQKLLVANELEKRKIEEEITELKKM